MPERTRKGMANQNQNLNQEPDQNQRAQDPHPVRRRQGAGKSGEGREQGPPEDRQGQDELKKLGVNYVVPDRAAFENAWRDVYKAYEGKVWPVGLVAKIKALQK